MAVLIDQFFSVDPSLDSVASNDRASLAWCDDDESLLIEHPDDTVRMEDARIIRNLIEQSEHISAPYWQLLSGGNASAITVTNGYEAGPFPGTLATRIQGTVNDTSVGSYVFIQKLISAVAGVGTVYIKSNTGVNQDVYFKILGDNEVTVTPQWARYSTNRTSSNAFTIGLRGHVTGASTLDISIYGLMLQDKEGQSDPTVPDEYVSHGIGTGPELCQVDPSDLLWTAYAGATITVSAPEISVARTPVPPVNGCYCLLSIAKGFEETIGTTSWGWYQLIIDVKGDDDAKIRVYTKINGVVSFSEVSTAQSTEFKRYVLDFYSDDDNTYTGYVQVQALVANSDVHVNRVSIRKYENDLGADGMKAFAYSNPNQVDANGVVTSDVPTNALPSISLLLEQEGANRPATGTRLKDDLIYTQALPATGSVLVDMEVGFGTDTLSADSQIIALDGTTTGPLRLVYNAPNDISLNYEDGTASASMPISFASGDRLRLLASYDSTGVARIGAIVNSGTAAYADSVASPIVPVHTEINVNQDVPGSSRYNRIVFRDDAVNDALFESGIWGNEVVFASDPFLSTGSISGEAVTTLLVTADPFLSTGSISGDVQTTIEFVADPFLSTGSILGQAAVGNTFAADPFLSTDSISGSMTTDIVVVADPFLSTGSIAGDASSVVSVEADPFQSVGSIFGAVRTGDEFRFVGGRVIAAGVETKGGRDSCDRLRNLLD